MLGTLADLLGNANGQTPIVLLVASAALIAAGWIGARVFRSLQRQGRRIGVLEQLHKSERTRRRQTEQTLREQGIELPYWPDDPAALHGVTATAGALEEARQEIAWLRSTWTPPADEQGPYTAEADAIRPVPPVPPLSDAERERYSRHRR